MVCVSCWPRLFSSHRPLRIFRGRPLRLLAWTVVLALLAVRLDGILNCRFGGNGAVAKPWSAVERVSATTPQIDLAWSSSPSLSADGRFVAFQSARRHGPQSYPGEGIWGQRVIVYDRILQQVTMELYRPTLAGIPPWPKDAMAPGISATGEHVAFQGYNQYFLPDEYLGQDLYDVFFYDAASQQAVRIPVDSQARTIAAAVAQRSTCRSDHNTERDDQIFQ